MKLILQFPTRSRPDKFFKVLDLYKDYATDWDDISVHVVCNTDDKSMNNSEVKERLDKYTNVHTVFADCKSKIEACNYGLKNRDEDWDIVVLVSDDMIPRVKGYDSRLKKDMKKYFPDTDGVLWYNDGHQKDKLCTQSILGRKYFDRFGYIYHPSYKSFFCDNEFVAVARKLNKLKYFPDTIIEHCHPDYKLCRTDKLYKFNLRYHGLDMKNFRKRKKNGFGLNSGS